MATKILISIATVASFAAALLAPVAAVTADVESPVVLAMGLEGGGGTGP